MPGQDIFADDWRECLRAHYQYIIRTRDTLTEKSLNEVMHQAGFSDAELYEMRLQVTMHVDDSGADFVPDEAVVEYFAAAEVAAPEAEPPAPVETATSVEAVAPVEVAESVEAPVVEESPAEETPQEDEPPPEPPGLTQLSLF